MDVCRRHGISGTTFYAWKAESGGFEASEAKRLKVLDARGRERETEKVAGRRYARQRRAERFGLKKMVTPAARREAVATQDRGVSERRACTLLGRWQDCLLPYAAT